jgi:hypothetical protein
MAARDGEQNGTRPVLAAKDILAALDIRSKPEVFGVPRRFGIGTILVVTAAYGALLALLRAMDWHRGVIAARVGFVSLIGLGQMLLYRAREPRKASIITGAVCLPVVQTLIYFLLRPRRGWIDPTQLVGWLFFSIALGGAAGYLAGGIVAGVFLIMDAVERAFGKSKT